MEGQLVTQTSNIIFTGPAGTGKTTAAKQRAVQICDGTVDDDVTKVAGRFRELIDRGRIIAVTLHPDYSYADWIEGYKPTTVGTELHWVVKPGVLRRAVTACHARPALASFFEVDQVITGSTGYSYVIRSVDSCRVDMRRVEGAQRSNSVGERVPVCLGDIEDLLAAGIDPADLSFSGQRAHLRSEVAARLGWPTTKMASLGGERAVYEHVLQRLGQMDLERPPIVLLVDEINRADPARLWGETITILEPNKREGQPEEQSVELQYSGDRLTIPANLFIIGTMNSADRSIAHFDVAYSRRFDKVWIGPDESLLPTDYAGVDVAGLLREVNQWLLRDGGRDRLVGHAELMRHKLEARREERAWDDDDDGRLRALAAALRLWLLPLLRDLLGNDLARVRNALKPAEGLIEVVANDISDETSMWGEAEQLLLDTGEWWNPDSALWDGQRVLSTLRPVAAARPTA
jgi:5-methylcytosine-specific restriction protein B